MAAAAISVREAFLSGGVVMYPLLLIVIGILVLAARAAWPVFGQARPLPPAAERWLHAILFWGAISVVVGFLGTTAGIIQMAQAVGLAGGVEAPLLWGGFGVALVTTIFGLLIFLLAAVLWFLLRQRNEALKGVIGAPSPTA